MTEGPAQRDRVGAADLEYDLAHDAGTADIPSLPSTLHPESHAALVATETSDSAGDYGYDLAHDIPKS